MRTCILLRINLRLHVFSCINRKGISFVTEVGGQRWHMRLATRARYEY